MYFQIEANHWSKPHSSVLLNVQKILGGGGGLEDKQQHSTHL